MPARLPLAIGDLHGRFDLLQAALERFPSEPLVFLGDLTDRGPASPQVVGRVRELVDAGRAQLCLGNHDQLLINAVLSGEHEQHWLANGGDTTLSQYAASPRSLTEDAEWLQAYAQPFVTAQHVLYSHAMRPSSDDPTAHIWGRPSDTPVYPLAKGLRLSVHGHTPLEVCPVGIELQDGTAVWFIDTGAVWSGHLCVFDPESLQAHLIEESGLPEDAPLPTP